MFDSTQRLDGFITITCQVSGRLLAFFAFFDFFALLSGFLGFVLLRLGILTFSGLGQIRRGATGNAAGLLLLYLKSPEIASRSTSKRK